MASVKASNRDGAGAHTPRGCRVSVRSGCGGLRKLESPVNQRECCAGTRHRQLLPHESKTHEVWNAHVSSNRIEHGTRVSQLSILRFELLLDQEKGMGLSYEIDSQSCRGSEFSNIVPGEGEGAMDTTDVGSGFRSTPSCARMTARSTRFCSSRMLPGQWYDKKAAMVSGGICRTSLLMRRLKISTKCSPELEYLSGVRGGAARRSEKR